ncbi:MAG: PAS domain-containing protein, partial [Bacteroidia bacterium]|nr:PAS domain-containing protein [Bacteroidia bacterium]
HEDHKGTLWIGTPKGVYTRDNDGIINFNELFDIPKVPINTIAQDHENNYVFSSYNFGIIVYRIRRTEQVINFINNTNGLNNIRIKSCNFDNNRNLWIGTNNGVDRIDWVSYLNTGQISLTHFDKSNGYYGVETNASSTDPFGNVWFGSVNGLIRFNAQSGSLRKITPQIKLNKIQLFLEDYSWEDEGYNISPNTGLPQNLILEHSKNYLSFDYSGIYLTAPDEVQYSFMLEGFDDDWAPITRESIAHYANISPGEYAFKIRATANGRDWSNPISYSFEVTPPFWRSPVFYVIYAILGFTILTLILRVRTRKLKQKQSELQQKVDIRTKELQSKNVELAKLSLVASKTDNAILIFDNNKELEWMNEGFTKLTGFTFDEVISIRGKKIEDLTNHESINSIVDDCIKNHKSKIYESKIATKDGHEFWASSTLTPIFDERNNLKNIVVIDTDITVRKIMEDQIKSSLTERGILLREIHHRVKNNLQIIISLFNLQSNYIADDNAQAALKEGQDRIKSMALIHEHFYQSDGLSKIDFDDYIYKLTDNLFLSYGIDNSNVNLNVKADAASLDIDTAVPCGLIINELVSNAIKHAFLPGVKGEIMIEFKQTDPLNYQLIVSDNGRGLPENFDFNNTDSLGMQLIAALTDQLDGEVKIESNNGTKISINFKNIYVPENPVLA